MKVKYIYYKLIVAIILIATVMCLFGGVGFTYAATSNYANVLDDLRKDPEFDTSAFPVVKDDYSLQVIQIAESTDDELFLYVYQPAAKTNILVATDINMSLSEEATNTAPYELELLNSEGVFAKYLVKNLTVMSNKAVRFYNITSIYRAFNSTIDDDYTGSNELNKVAFKVGKIFAATTSKGQVIYSQEPTYTVKIINPYVGYVVCLDKAIGNGNSVGFRPWKGIKWDMFDVHYVAFSTDWDIDRLVSADVSYHYCTGTMYYDYLFKWNLNAEVSYGNDNQKTVTLKADDKLYHESKSWGKTRNTYSWDRISTPIDFISRVSDSERFNVPSFENMRDNIKDKQWVLNFAETERTQKANKVLNVYKKYTSDFTKVSQVTILRLEFETDGTVYNLGAVSDMVSSKKYPDEVSKHWYDCIVNFFKKVYDFFKNFSWWHWLLLILGVVVVVIINIAIAKWGIVAVAKFIVWLLKKIAQAICWVICLPFRGIAALVRKIRGD